MQREVEQLFCLCHLHDGTFVDNTDTVGNETHDGKVVGDEKVSQLFFFLEFFQQVQHLGTNGNVQGGNGLICHNQFRFHDHGTGQADTLTLSAGKLMRITGQMLRQKTNLLNDVFYFFYAVCFVFEQMEVIKSFGNDIVYGSTLI